MARRRNERLHSWCRSSNALSFHECRSLLVFLWIHEVRILFFVCCFGCFGFVFVFVFVVVVVVVVVLDQSMKSFLFICDSVFVWHFNSPTIFYNSLHNFWLDEYSISLVFRFYVSLDIFWVFIGGSPEFQSSLLSHSSSCWSHISFDFSSMYHVLEKINIRFFVFFDCWNSKCSLFKIFKSHLVCFIQWIVYFFLSWYHQIGLNENFHLESFWSSWGLTTNNKHFKWG
jgi:hypothetical protein